jgi:hypothetical protein
MTDVTSDIESGEAVVSATGAVDDGLVAELVARAQAGGVKLTGEGGLLQQLTKRVLESALEGELTDHLGHEPGERAEGGRENYRNGHRSKTVITESGPVEIAVPRDRAGSFEPQPVKKRQRRLGGGGRNGPVAVGERARSKAHLIHVGTLSSRATRTRIRRVIRETDEGSAPRFPLTFRPAGLRFLDLPSPAGDFSSPCGRPTRQGLDLDGVSTFRTSKTRLGWAPPLPRDQRCPPLRLSYPKVAWCLPAPGPVTAANTPSTRSQIHEASSRVHLRSPVQPSPHLLHPDGRDALGLEHSASHPAVASDAWERGDGPRTLARSSADRYLLHVAVPTYVERLRVAH